MIFCSKATPRTRRSAGGTRLALTAALCLTLLGACGGGTSTVTPFRAQRVLVFGDEMSTITASGLKYSINGLNTSNAVDCTAQPLWVQSVANLYGFSFAVCNPSYADPLAFMLAFAGAKVADVQAQVEAQVAAGGFRNYDLATVLAGTNDLLEIYGRYPGESVADMTAEAGARGALLAQVVNRLVGLGVKVILSDVPDLGFTPYAQAQKALDPTGPDRSLILSNLTSAFNDQLGVNIVLDGRYIGLVQSQLRIQAISRSPATFGLTDITNPACTVALPKCTTSTLAAGATATSNLWADSIWMGPNGHAQLGALAVDRAQRNPF